MRYIWVALIAIAVIVALVLSESGEETRAELDYLEEIDAQAVELARSGDALRDVVSRLQRIDRVEFTTVIEGIREDLAAGQSFVGLEPPLASLLSVRAQYRNAIRAWGAGIDEFEESILDAADNPESLGVVDPVVEGLANIRAGDDFFASLIVDMRRDDVPSPLTEYPRVVLSPAEGSLVSLAAAYIDSARSPNNGLALRPSIAVSQIVFDPDWQLNPSDEVVVPVTEQISFTAVITNSGNVASDPENLVLTLVGGPEEVRLQAEVPGLSPNQQVAIPFDPIEVSPGGVYEVTVTLVVTGEDSNGEDNERSVQFTVNEE